MALPPASSTPPSPSVSSVKLRVRKAWPNVSSYDSWTDATPVPAFVTTHFDVAVKAPPSSAFAYATTPVRTYVPSCSAPPASVGPALAVEAPVAGVKPAFVSALHADAASAASAPVSAGASAPVSAGASAASAASATLPSAASGGLTSAVSGGFTSAVSGCASAV